MIKRILLCCLVCVAFQSMSSAAEPPTSEAAQRRALLMEGRYTELDRQMSGLQQAYGRGAISDEQLSGAFRAFYYSDSAMETKLDQWVAEFPRSYAALLSRGIYYMAMGWSRRGSKYARDTTDEQFAGMGAYQSMALRDLSKSVELDPKPILSYREGIEIGKAQGMKKHNRVLLEQALRKDPQTVVVRRAYLKSLRPKWNGSPEEMAAFVDECRKANVPAATLKEFSALAIADSGWVKIGKKDFAGAEKDYAQALSLNPDDRDALTQMGHVLIRQQKYEQALGPLSKLISLEPRDTYALSARGSIYHRMKKSDQAAKDYAQAADLGDAYSENELGKFYWFGIAVRQDKERALKLFRQAAEQGNKDAQNNLAWALTQ